MTVGPDGAPCARDGSAAAPAVPEQWFLTADAPQAPERDDAAGTPTPPEVPDVRAQRPPVPGPPPRPRIVDEPGILGLSRLTRSRFGSRLFTLFFVFVYAVIVVQMIYAILDEPW